MGKVMIDKRWQSYADDYYDEDEVEELIVAMEGIDAVIQGPLRVIDVSDLYGVEEGSRYEVWNAVNTSLLTTDARHVDEVRRNVARFNIALGYDDGE